MQEHDRFAALEQRVADLEQLHAAELAEIRDERERAAREADGSAAAEKKRDDERRDAVKRVTFALNSLGGLRFTVRPTEQVVEAGKRGKLVSPNDAEPLRRTLPPLQNAVAALRVLVERDPWPEGVAQLDESAERESAAWWIAKACSVLAQFDALVAADEAARRPRAPVG